MEDAVWAAGQPRAHSTLGGAIGNGPAGPGTRSHLGTFARAQQESPEHSRHSPAWAPTLHLSHLWREVSRSVPLCVRQIPHLRQHSLGQRSGPFWVSGHLSILTEGPKEFSCMWILANDVYWI